MSHHATKWAMQQRGLKPATKIVLWCLAHHHNHQTGECFPMQETIAAECEMSRSTVNLHLTTLEERGLIRRVSSLNDQTKRQRPTRYLLAIGGGSVSENRTEAVSELVSELVSDFPEPCPKNEESRVLKSDSNLGREPKEVVEEDPRESAPLLSRVMAAVRLNPNDLPSSYWLPNVAEAHIQRWVAAGIPPDMVVQIAEEEAKRFTDPPKGPKALDVAMRRWIKAQAEEPFAAPALPSPTGAHHDRPTRRESRGDAKLRAFISGA